MRRLHETAEPSPPSRFRPGPRTAALKELDAIVLKALRKDPAERHQSAEELARDLERWQARPVLTPGGRLLRAVAAPLVALLLLPALLWWSPWEELRLTSSPTVHVGPNRTTEVNAIARGPGYDEAVFEVERGGKRTALPLGKVGEGGRVDASLPSWDDLTAALGIEGEVEGAKAEARIRVHGWLGRALDTRVDLLLDNQPPRIDWVTGAETVDSPKLRLLRGTGPARLRIRAHEPLDAGRCFLNRNVRPEATDGGPELEFIVPAEARGEVQVDLVDLAGNRLERAWTVEWVGDQAPSLISAHEYFTNVPGFRLPLAWEDAPGRVEVEIVGSKPVEVTVVKKESSYSAVIPVDFSGAPEGKLESRTVKVRTWPAVMRAGGKARPDEVIVHYLRRTLEIVERPKTSSGFPLLAAHDRQGRPVLKDLKWQVSVFWQGTDKRAFEQATDPRATLDVGTHVTRRRGKYRGGVWVEDNYGNKSDLLPLSFSHAVEKPQVAFGPVLGGTIHHATCTCNQPEPGPPLSIPYAIAYGFLDDIDLELRATDPVKGRTLVKQLLDSRECVVSRQELFQVLEPGQRNKLFLVARDRDDKGECNAACILAYEPPLKIEFPRESVLPQKEMNIRVRVRGPRVKRVRIGGIQARPEGDVFAAAASIQPSGYTTIDVDVDLENGCSRRESARYSLVPLAGEVYSIPVPGLGKIRLDYSDDGLWHTRPGDWRSLCSAYRRAKQQPGSIPEKGVKLDEAEMIADWVQSALEAMLGTRVEVRLPRLSELELWPAEADGVSQGTEWLDPRDDRVKHLLSDGGGVLAKRGQDGSLAPERAFRDVDDSPFRLVIALEEAARLPSLAEGKATSR